MRSLPPACRPSSWKETATTQGIDFYCNCATTRYDSLHLKFDRRHGRNTLRGPGLFVQDLAVNKTFRPTERFSFAFRAEAYNVFNHVNLGQPNNNVTSADSGRITALADDTTMRRLQFGLRMGF
jgi:hypothetical protein